MRISLERLLRTGQMGDLTLGMSAEQVRALLGEPDAFGSISRKYPRPCVWLYGSVELYFRQKAPHDLRAVFWDAKEKGPLRLPAHCVVEDWALSSAMARSDIESWLQSIHLAVVKAHSPPASPTTVLVLSSGVNLTFDERERLYSVYTSPASQEKAE